MSNDQTRRVIPPKPKRSTKSKVLLALSYFASACILIWSAWVPLQAVRSDTHNQKSLDLQQKVEIKRTNAEHVRREALAIDAELMDTIRQRRIERTSGKPTSYESKQWLRRHVDKVHRQIKQLGKPEKGTVEWEYQQELIRSLEDAIL